MENKKFEESLKNAAPINGYLKRLLPHELELYQNGQSLNITHEGSSSIWLEAYSSIPPDGKINVYRPMGDNEILYLLENNQLPASQPYQAIIEGENGRIYANKYLNGNKWTNSNPTTIVEFTVPIDLMELLKEKQMKIEDGALSVGLGCKAGKGLPLFNERIRDGLITYRIVKIKRSKNK
ncbi:unnamed protein product [Adineta ricciae]|uniref:Uncharacterized protein n=1 Tax=Adineta ricciae TaxID=249248 RepID=A0A816BST0_ADIRI|nr:unnamed protein product [Adineta ricciae]